jgi:hypothetical protein
MLIVTAIKTFLIVDCITIVRNDVIANDSDAIYIEKN